MSDQSPLEYPARSQRPLPPRPRAYRANGSDITRLLAILSTIVLAAAFVSVASAATITPFSEATEGNHAANDLQNPFDQTGLNKRFQQIWHVGLFGSDPVILTGIGFRLDSQASSDGAPLSKVLNSLEISFGLTALAPSAMTSSFASNTSGVTMQKVVDQTGVTISGTDSAGNVPNAFDIVFSFDAGQTFALDPSQNLNLIMDLQASGSGTFAPLDALTGASFLTIGGIQTAANSASGFDSFGFLGNSGEPMALVAEFITQDTGGSTGGSPSPVPLPSSLVFLMSGVGIWGLVSAGHRRRRPHGGAKS
ncbi:MAG: hypothetical protein AAF899_10740 [Pseudomonadota bacterium]